MHTRRTIDELLDEHGLAPRRDLGQNFVADANTVRRIARLAEVGAGDHVVEIGAGLGSLTLALASLDVVSLPSRVVEPLIAASIVFVGVENLWRRGAEPPGRWALTLAFGLIHGFGFASVLRDLGLASAKGGILMPLLTFNLGVEVGQIAIAEIGRAHV